jgi:hypothetical protein
MFTYNGIGPNPHNYKPPEMQLEQLTDTQRYCLCAAHGLLADSQ